MNEYLQFEDLPEIPFSTSIFDFPNHWFSIALEEESVPEQQEEKK